MNTEALVEPATKILAILQDIQILLNEQAEPKQNELISLISDLRRQQNENSSELSPQQISLLLNLAELSVKLLERAKPFDEVKHT